jgi:putative ABC transport system permease protein
MTSGVRGKSTTRPADVVGLSFSALWQQKVRTILTIIGVVIGTFALVLSLAVGRGVDHAIVSLFHEDARLRKIHVNEKYETTAEEVPEPERIPKGAMSDAKQKRISKALIREWGYNHARKQRKPLNSAALKLLGALEHVERIEPNVWGLAGKASVDGKTEQTGAASVPLGSSFLRARLLAGRLFTADDGDVAIVHEFFLYRLGLTGDDEASKSLGKTIRFEYVAGQSRQVDLVGMLSFGPNPLSEKESQTLKSALKRLAFLVRLLPIPVEERSALNKVFDHVTTTTTSKGTTYSQDFKIVGVVREQNENDEKPGPFGNWNLQEANVLLPNEAATKFYLKAPEHAEAGFNSVIVTVDQEDNVKEMEKRIGALGFNVWSLVQVIDTVRLNVLMITLATAFVAIVALVVAAVGITNTMIMSVLERSHEIGVMKALGARNGHILLMFVMEGAAIGIVGSLIGLALGWFVSIPGDAFARSIMEPQTQTPVKETLFLFTPWLVLGVPALVIVITTLAALYPARRAARVDPVTSLRHE